MTDQTDFVIPGASHGSLRLDTGESLRITNIEGSQVVDLWAFSPLDTSEFLSNEHTRSCLQKLIPAVGDSLYTNQRRKVLTITADSSPGCHDLLLSACDEQRYALLGHDGYHKNCADNLRAEMEAIRAALPEIPSPFNIFQNVTIGPGGGLQIDPPLVEPGQSVTLRAEMPALIVMSACPMDIAMTNGPDKRSKPVRVEKIL